MSKESFASQIIDKLQSEIGRDDYTASTPSVANAAIAQSITEYILENAKVYVQYVGVMPDSSPDPLESDTFEVVGSCSPVPVSQDFNSWLANLKANIVAGFTIQTGENDLVFQAYPFNPLTDIVVDRDTHLKPIAEAGGNSVQQNVWECICEGILNWLNGTPNPSAQGTGTHNTSEGLATVIRNEVS